MHYFKKKLLSNNNANHLIESISLIGFDMKHNKAIMCDRASTNKAVVNELNNIYLYIK